MQDFHEYNQKPQKPRVSGGTILAIIAVALVFSILGGITAVAYLTRRDETLASANSQSPSNTSRPLYTAGASASETPAPAAGNDEPLPSQQMNLGGAAFILTGANPVVEIAEKVGPCIVGITNRQMLSSSYYGMYPFGQRQEVPEEEVDVSTGSGVIITQDGYILTNAHVVEGASTVVVTLPGDETDYQATVVGSDTVSDLAVIKIDATGLTAAPLGDSSALRVGELAVAIGNPLGQKLAGTVTCGIISAINRSVTVDSTTLSNLIQTDAAINPGNSGGALINSLGEVIGINSVKTAYSTSGTSVEGIGYAIPINDARAIAEQLIEKGRIDYPMLGIYEFNSGGGDLRQVYDIPEGVIVGELVSGGPAEKAGIQEYDIITHIDGQAVVSFTELRAIIQKHAIGDRVELTVYRSVQNPEEKIMVTLEANQTSQSGGEGQAEPAPTPVPVWPPQR